MSEDRLDLIVGYANLLRSYCQSIMDGVDEGASPQEMRSIQASLYTTTIALIALMQKEYGDQG